MRVFTERDIKDPWWVSEPAPKPNKGYKFIIRHPDMLVMVQDRRYRVRAAASLVSPEKLTLVLTLWMGRDRHHDDRVDMYSPQARQEFIARAAAECKLDATLIERDLGVILRECERMREATLKSFAEERRGTRSTLQ